MPDDSDVLRIPWLSVLNDLKAEMTGARRDFKDEIGAIRTELREALRTFEAKATQDHAMLAAEVKADSKRIDALEQALREERAREETRAEEQKKREEQAKKDQDARDKRTNLRIAIASIIAVAAGAVAAIGAPLLSGHH